MSTHFRMEPDRRIETQSRMNNTKREVVRSLQSIEELIESIRWLGSKLDNDSSESAPEHHPAGPLLSSAVQQLAAEHEFVEFNLRELGFFQSLLEEEYKADPAPTFHLIKPDETPEPEGVQHDD